VARRSFSRTIGVVCVAASSIAAGATGAKAAPEGEDVAMPAGASSAAPPASSSGADPSKESEAPPPIAWTAEGDTRKGLDPLPSTGQFIDYGFAFTSEALLAAGGICKNGLKENCVLGGGGGIAINTAYRAPGYSLGAVYEVTFHDSSNIYQRGVLQQARAEWRVRPRWLFISESVVAFLGLGAGVAGYGDNWAISTYGPSAHAMVGGEIDLGVKVALVVSIAYRALYFKSFEDASGQVRPTGVSHMLGLTLGIELHEPI
jgi:hypothetical protein